MTDADRAALKDRIVNKLFVAGQMDAQGYAAEKFKIGSGGTVLAMSRRLLKEATDDLSALIAAGLSEAPQDECTCDGGDQGDGLCAVPHDPTCPRRDSDR